MMLCFIVAVRFDSENPKPFHFHGDRRSLNLECNPRACPAGLCASQMSLLIKGSACTKRTDA